MANKARIEITAEDKTRAAIASVKSGFQSLAGSAAAVSSAFGLFGGAAAIGSIAAVGRSVLDAGDQLAKLSQKTGIAVESLSALQYAGELSDVSIEAIATSVRKLSTNMADTAAGTGEARDAFTALGISVKTAEGNLKSSDAVLREVADKFAGMEDGAGKSALAVRIFGRAGADLIPLLNAGSSGLGDMADEAARLGVIMSGDLARNSEIFNDNLTRLQASARGLAVTIAGPLVDALAKYSSLLVELGGNPATSSLAIASANRFIAEAGGDVDRAINSVKDKLAENIRNNSAFQNGIISDFVFGNRSKGLYETLDALKVLRKRIAADAARDKDSPLFDFAGQPKVQAPILAGETKQKKENKTHEDQNKAFVEAINSLHQQALAAAEADQEIVRLREHYTDLVDPAASVMRELRKFEEIAPALGISADEIERIRDAFRERIAVEEFGEKLKDITPEIEKQKQLADELGLSFSSAFEDAIVGGKGFAEILRGIAQDIVKIFVRKSITEPAGGFVSDLFGKVFGGAKAIGGPVSGGTPYLVGERGPELFVPRTNGAIVPNNALATAGVTQNITIDARGADAGVESRIRRAMREAKDAAVAEVQILANRGGSFAAAVGRR